MLLSRTLRYCTLAILVCGMAGAGCSKKPPAPTPTETTVTVEEPAGESKVLLSNLRYKVNDEGIAYIEVDYEFTEGAPVRHYQCEFAFPGTSLVGLKELQNWELKKSGTVRSGFATNGQPVKTITAIFREAESPSLGYYDISNTIEGNLGGGSTE